MVWAAGQTDTKWPVTEELMDNAETIEEDPLSICLNQSLHSHTYKKSSGVLHFQNHTQMFSRHQISKNEPMYF